MDNDKEVTRWYDLTISERGKAINLFLSISIATLGFVISSLVKEDFHFSNCFEKIFLVTGALFLLFNIIVLLIITHLRVSLFNNITKELQNQNETNDLRKQNNRRNGIIKNSLIFSVYLLSIGEFFIVIGFFIHIYNKYSTV